MEIKEVTIYQTSDNQRFDSKLDAAMHVNNERLIDKLNKASPDCSLSFIERAVTLMMSHTELVSDWLAGIQLAYAEEAAVHKVTRMSSGESVVHVTDADLDMLNSFLALAGSIYRLGRANVIYIGLYDTAGSLCNGEDADDWLSNDKAELEEYVKTMVHEAMSTH